MELTPLNVPSKLAPTPTAAPKYSVTVKNAAGETVVVADPNVTRGLVALMNTHAAIGGAASHWGGPSAFAEMSAAAHAIMFSVKGRQWHEAFNFVNDAGHCENGIYAVRASYGFDGFTFDDLKGFRAIESKLTGHGESHLNPEGVLLSNGPLGSGIPQAQGLALGDKLAGRERTTLVLLSDGAAMEGEAKEALAAVPGLAAKGKLNPFVCLISDNNTKLSGRIDTDSFLMTPTFDALEPLGWEVIKVKDGHDLQAVYLAIEKAVAVATANPMKPVAVWFKTIKGKGNQATEKSASGGHGFPLKNGEKIIEFVSEIFGGNTPTDLLGWAQSLNKKWQDETAARMNAPTSLQTPVPMKKAKVQDGLALGAIKAAEAGLPVVSVAADLAGSTRICLFNDKYPERSFDMGVAESNMVSVGVGLSKAGLIPIVDTFAQFGITKGNLPLMMASLSQAPVIGIFTHTGFQDAADGASHQATTYLSATASIPHVVDVVISSAEQGEAYMLQAIQRIADAKQAGQDGETVLFFAGREDFPVSLGKDLTYDWGKAIVLRDGKDVVLLATGPMVPKALSAAKKLESSGINACVIENAFVNRVDVSTIGAAVKACKGRLITIEDHQIALGMGAMAVHSLSLAGIACNVESIGINGEFGRSSYKADQLYAQYGLSVDDIVDSARAICG